MNKILIDDYIQKNDKVKLIIHECKVRYIECINYYDLNFPIENILKKLEFGEVIYEKDRIVTMTKIKNF